jgi:hypothetical protein
VFFPGTSTRKQNLWAYEDLTFGFRMVGESHQVWIMGLQMSESGRSQGCIWGSLRGERLVLVNFFCA